MYGNQHTQTGERGNGNRAINAQRFNPEALLSRSAQANLARDLNHPGKTTEELLMRTNLDDPNFARDVALLMAKFDEFGMVEEARSARYYLAALTSVGGKARLELLQAITGILSPSLMGVRESGRHSRGNREQEQ